MFSIIIPLYNKAPYVEKAIRSVLDQTCREFELIVVDDGSTDNSWKIVQNLFKKYQQDSSMTPPLGGLIGAFQPNSGVSIARNNGVKHAKYDFIAFLDADDWWDKDFLKEMKSLIAKYPNASIFGSKYFWVKNGKYKKSVNHESNNFKGYIDYFKAYTYAWWMPLTSISTVIKKSVLLEINGFKPNIKFGEDFDLWIRIVSNYKIAYSNKALAFYNQDVTSKDRALGTKLWNPENHYIFNLDYLHSEEERNPSLKKLIDGLRVRALLRYYLAGKYKKETQVILNRVDFTKQSKYYQRIYHWPKSLVRFYFLTLKIGSMVKQQIIKLTN